MKAICAVLGFLALAACSDPVENAQRRLNMVIEADGSVEDVCRESRKVAEAALEAHSARYAELSLRADINCQLAGYHQGESWDQATNKSAVPIKADNMEADNLGDP